jgi:hypothetical protein
LHIRARHSRSNSAFRLKEPARNCEFRGFARRVPPACQVDDNSGRWAILKQCLTAPSYRDGPFSIALNASAAAGGVAFESEGVFGRKFSDLAWIAIAAQPNFRVEASATRREQVKPAVGTSHTDIVAVGRDDDVRLRARERQGEADNDLDSAEPPPRRLPNGDPEATSDD